MSHFYCMARQRESKSSDNKIEVEVMCSYCKVLVTGSERSLFVRSFGGEL